MNDDMEVADKQEDYFIYNADGTAMNANIIKLPPYSTWEKGKHILDEVTEL